MKSEGSAREYSPGHQKSEQRSENKSKSSDRDKSNRADRGENRSEHNAKNDQEKSRSERKATNERDHNGSRNRNEARGREHNGAATGASEGAEGRSGRGRGSITSVTTEQKTKIRSVFTRHHVEPARNLNVSVNVGVRLPHSVHLYPIPADVIEIVPEYRDYEYIMLDDERIAIIDPDTYEVVDIIVLT
jgi:hypothetical protein